MQVGARVSLKVATKGSLRGKKLWKFRISGCFSKAKMEECYQNVWKVFYQFGIIIPCSAIYFLDVRVHFSLKVATKGFLRVKKLWKLRFLGCFSKAKSEECNQNVWNVFYQFGITIPCSATYFLEAGARVLLKVATKGSVRGKKALKI